MRKKLSWKVYVSNYGNIEEYDVFSYDSLIKYVKSLKKEHGEDHDAIMCDLRAMLMYLFNHKYEWETEISAYTPRIPVEDIDELKDYVDSYEREYGTRPTTVSVNLMVSKKIDVFQQIDMNWDRFSEYVISNLDSI